MFVIIILMSIFTISSFNGMGILRFKIGFKDLNSFYEQDFKSKIYLGAMGMISMGIMAFSRDIGDIFLTKIFLNKTYSNEILFLFLLLFFLVFCILSNFFLKKSNLKKMLLHALLLWAPMNFIYHDWVGLSENMIQFVVILNIIVFILTTAFAVQVLNYKERIH